MLNSFQKQQHNFFFLTSSLPTRAWSAFQVTGHTQGFLKMLAQEILAYRKLLLLGQHVSQMLPLLHTLCLVPTTLLMLHGLSPTSQAENEVKCSGNGLCHSFLCIIKRPKCKHFWSSTIWAKMPKLKSCIKGGVDQTAAVDWLCTDKPDQRSHWAIHVCKDRDALLSHTPAADLINDITWLTFARCTHSIAAF